MYRVYVENVGGPDALDTILDALTRSGIDGATVYDAVGVDNGERERSFVIETTGPDAAGPMAQRRAVYNFAERLKRIFEQRAVLVVETADVATFV